MSKSFQRFRLGELTEIIAGGDKPKIFSENKTSKNTIPVFANAEGNNGLQGYTDLPRIIEPAVTIAARGSKVGFAALRKQPFFPIVRLLTLIPQKDKLDVDYLFYNLKLNRQNGTGSGQPQITIPEISDKIISIPPILTQQKIAKVLSDLDAKIELNNKINAELEAMAKLIYDYWFVQFEFPHEFKTVKTDEKGRRTELVEVRPYKSSGGKMVKNEELKREVPEGWENGTIDKIADLVRGVSYSKNDIRTKDDKDVTPILRATNITGSKIDLDDMVYVPSTLVSDNQIINKHDILITMSSGSIDHIGKNGLYYFDEKVAFGAFCAKLIAKRGFSLYLFLYTQSDFVSATIKNECLGTNINNLNGSLVKGFKIVIPDEKFLNLFNQKVEPLYHKIGLNQKENQKLAELRDWLLPMLMNGQVRVGDVAKYEIRGEDLGMVAEGRGEYGGF